MTPDPKKIPRATRSLIHQTISIYPAVTRNFSGRPGNIKTEFLIAPFGGPNKNPIFALITTARPSRFLGLPLAPASATPRNYRICVITSEVMPAEAQVAGRIFN